MCRAHGSSGKFWGVEPAGDTRSRRWAAKICVGTSYAAAPSPCNRDAATGRALGLLTASYARNGCLHVGQFASPEGAALAIARRLHEDAQLAEHIAGLQHVARRQRGRKRKLEGGGSRDGGPSTPPAQGSGGSGNEPVPDFLLIEAVEVWSDDDGGHVDVVVECADVSPA